MINIILLLRSLLLGPVTAGMVFIGSAIENTNNPIMQYISLFADIVTVVFIVINGIVAGRTYKKLIREAGKLNSGITTFYDLAEESSKKGVIADVMSKYYERDSIRGRHLMIHAYVNNTMPTCSGDGEMQIRQAAELFDYIGILIRGGMIPLQFVRDAMRKEIINSWYGISSVPSTSQSSLVEQWRKEHDNDEYLHNFKQLAESMKMRMVIEEKVRK